MTLEELKEKVLALIEEIDTEQEGLTSDPDIEAKLPYVINQVMFELARMKKIPVKETMEITEGLELDLNDLDNFYQLNQIRCMNKYGKIAEFEIIENFVKFLEEGTADIYYYRYPTRITKKTASTFKLELDEDALEIMPYGVAADLLKSDVSNGYGQIYAARYREMLQTLDPRVNMGSIYIEGGVEI